MAHYKTIEGPTRVEIDKIKGSRFIGVAHPASSEATALAAIDALRAEFSDARHHCFAWRLGMGTERFRYSDDGEPRGTGGPPILKHIDGRDLKDVVVVVIRYFGGTKLGTGGLLRAYSAAAAAALDAATVVEVELTTPVHVAYGYEISGAVKATLTAHSLSPADETFGAQVSMTVNAPVEVAQAFVDAIIERTAGQAKVTVGDEGDSREGGLEGR